MREQLYVGTRKGLFTYERSTSGTWSIVREDFLGEPVSCVLPDSRDGSLYVALNLGHFGVKLHRSDDGGDHFREVSAPSYPASDHANAPSVELLWCLEAAAPTQPRSLWAGTIPGGLFRSDDGGESWELNGALWGQPSRSEWFGGGYDSPGIHSVAVDSTDPKRILVGISCGGVWLTRDAGESWTVSTAGMFADYMPPDRREDPVIQDPHRLILAPSDNSVVWVQHHNGVFRSTDGSQNWKSLHPTPSGFGFALAVHPKDADTAWLVPLIKDECRVPLDGKVVVARTRDGGESFELLSEGLPQEHAYDMIYRHGLDVSPDGNTLAMGSTTGSLWVSSDQGDQFATVSHCLPPIYTVRFSRND